MIDFASSAIPAATSSTPPAISSAPPATSSAPVKDKEGNKPFDSDISDFKSEKLRRDQVYLWNETTDEGKRTRNLSLRCPMLDFSVMLLNVLLRAYKFVEKLHIDRGLRICGYGPCLSKFESSTNQFIHVCREVYYCSKECQTKHLRCRF